MGWDGRAQAEMDLALFELGRLGRRRVANEHAELGGGNASWEGTTASGILFSKNPSIPFTLIGMDLTEERNLN